MTVAVGRYGSVAMGQSLWVGCFVSVGLLWVGCFMSFGLLSVGRCWSLGQSYGSGSGCGNSDCPEFIK